MNIKRLSLPQMISAGAILVVIIAAFLPWASFLGVSASGIEGDGVITLIVGIAGLAVLAFTSGLFMEPRGGKVADIALIVLAAIPALIGLIDTINAGGLAAIGMYLTLIAGLVWLGAAIWHLVTAKNAPQTAGQYPGQYGAPGQYGGPGQQPFQGQQQYPGQGQQPFQGQQFPGQPSAPQAPYGAPGQAPQQGQPQYPGQPSAPQAPSAEQPQAQAEPAAEQPFSQEPPAGEPGSDEPRA